VCSKGCSSHRGQTFSHLLPLKFSILSSQNMDRAQELRSLMKVGAKKEDQVPMSGKDKAKLLKMMKEQNKQKEQPANHGHSKPKPHNHGRIVAPAQSGLPSDFFDAPAATPVSAKAPSVQSNTTTPANNTISNLPKGFFDNPVEDLSARGITMDQYTARMEKEEQAELDSFLTQLKEVEGEREHLEEASAAREESTREYEEEAAQMAYLANLIALRAQSEKLKKSSTGDDKGGVSEKIVEEGNEALHHLLKEVNEVRAATQTAPSAALDVDNILYQKLAQTAAQKRKREAILSNILSTSATDVSTKKSNNYNHKEESGSGSNSDNNSDSESEDEEETDSKMTKPAPKYTPLNFMNWTSRTY